MRRVELLMPLRLLLQDVAAGMKSAVTVFGTDDPTPDGAALRDNIHVCDLARAHVLAIEHAEDWLSIGRMWCITGSEIIVSARTFSNCWAKTMLGPKHSSPQY